MSRFFKEHPLKSSVEYGNKRVLSAEFQRSWWGCKTTLTFESGGTHVNYTSGVSGEKCVIIQEFLEKTMKEIPDELSVMSGGYSIPFK